MTDLLTLSDNFCLQAHALVQKLGLHTIARQDEQWVIGGSVAYSLALPGSDIDCYVITPNPRRRLIDILGYFGEYMIDDPSLKKRSVNNFYDTYETFDAQKKDLLKDTNMKQFMIDATYYHNDALSKHTTIELHVINQQFIEPFPELLTLDTQTRGNFLIIKNFISTSLPFFWNRSYLLYQGFLAGYDTPETMIEFLEKNNYQRLIR